MRDSRQPDLALSARLEALLFVAPEPATVRQLASALDVTSSEVETALGELAESLVGRGVRLQRAMGHVQMTTAPELAEPIQLFLGLQATAHLSRAAVETLAIIAYKQPVTRPQIDSIRGVNSDTMMRSLLHKGLILESGREEGPGRPILYATSPEFFQHFGISSLSDLPVLESSGSTEEAGREEVLKG